MPIRLVVNVILLTKIALCCYYYYYYDRDLLIEKGIEKGIEKSGFYL